MSEFVCQCPAAGQCTLHNIVKGKREHSICQGGPDIKPSIRKQYLEGWGSPEPITIPMGPRAVPLPAQARVGGVGTELTKLVGWFKTPGCGCEQHANLMDINGINWCAANIDTIVVWISDAASKMGVLGYTLDRVPGFDITTKGLVLLAIANAKLADHRRQQDVSKPSDPYTPIPGPVPTVRNLAYHLWPRTEGGNWLKAIEQIKRRIELFNGVRSISVVTDSTTATLQQVQAEFAGVRVDNWLTFPNSPDRREGVSFVPLLNTLPRDDSVTFWAHGKSTRHHDGSVCVKWAETQYRLLLDHWPTIETALTNFPLAVCFKRYMRFGPTCKYRWHGSGGVYWFRNRDAFAISGWDNLGNWFGCTEAWPGDMFPSTQAFCIGPDDVGDMYQSETWATIQPELDKLFEGRQREN